METLKSLLLNVDAMILIMVFLGLFIVYELYSGEAPFLRWFPSIQRRKNPIFYWLLILFHLVILGIIVYARLDGLRMPLSDFFA